MRTSGRDGSRLRPVSLRLAAVGCGAISARHLAGWRRIPEVEIVALCDPDLVRATARQQEFAPGARIFHAIDALLAGQAVDIIDIITPPHTHADLCRAAEAAGAHFLVQKPLCGTIEEARGLVAELAGYDRVYGVHENHRYRPWFRGLCEKARAGALGTLRSLRLAQHDPYPPPESFKRASPHGVLLEYGVHLIDMARALLGEPLRVSARLHQVNRDVHGDSLALVTLDFAEATATVDVSWKASGLHQGEVLLIGDAGEAWYEGRMTRGNSARFRIVERGAVTVDEIRSPTDDYAESFYLLQREFVDAIVSGKPFTQSVQTNLRTLATTFAAYEEAMRMGGRAQGA
jgi:D-apiose dehydrogenase